MKMADMMAVLVDILEHKMELNNLRRVDSPRVKAMDMQREDMVPDIRDQQIPPAADANCPHRNSSCSCLKLSPETQQTLT